MFWKSKKNKANGQNQDKTPAEDIEIARHALKQGDARHAVEHLAWALKSQPQHPEARTLLDQILANHSAPLEVVRWDKPPIPYAIAAVEAYIHIRQNNPDRAFSIMASIYQAVSGLPFLPWIVEWAENRPLLSTTSSQTMLALLSSLNSKLTPDLRQSERTSLKKLLPLFTYYTETQPQEPMLAVLLSILYRKLGEADEALALAQKVHSTHPGYFTATVLGNAHREKGEINRAIAAFQEALSFDPNDIAIRLDIGDTLCETGQIEEGLRAYQEVLNREPKHAWAYPSYLYYRSLLDPDGNWKSQLEYFAKDHPGNDRAKYLMNQLMPYIVDLPEPSDATINIARQLANERGFSGLSLSVSSMESPSAYLSLQLLQMEQSGKPPDFKVEVGQIQRPDPRLPRGKVDFLLWRYKGTIPEPNFPPPSPEVASVVGELAILPYEANNWWIKAQIFARRVGPSRLNDLLGTMVHPPTRPAQIPIWDWLQKVQFAAAFIIARLDEGWEGSLRKGALFSLARGPLDWTVAAAIVALCLIVNKEGIGKEEVEALYKELFNSLPRPGAVPYEQALIACSFYIQPSPELAQLARKAINDM